VCVRNSRMLKEDQKKQIRSVCRTILSEDADYGEYSAFLTDRTNLRGRADAICFPQSTQEVADLVRIASRERIAMVPSGGRTGYAGGAVPDGGIVVSLARMSKIDYGSGLLHVGAGAITANIHRRAEQEGMMFPVDFASSGSSFIGGNIATNAGGIHVIRYGMIRNWIVSLRVVTGAGQILDLGANVQKDNTGPDLKHIFIGSEGIFGIITEAVLRLTRKPHDTTLGMTGAASLEEVLGRLQEAKATTDLLAFECFDRRSALEVMAHLDLPEPMAISPWYAILEWEGEAEFPFDLAVAISSEQKKQFWKYREGISESLSRHRIYKNDVSIPGGAMPSYVEKIRNLAESLGLDLAVFGHAGDENLHINLICRSSMSADEFNDRAAQFTVQSYELIRSYKGSISAEHGIGLLKREDFARYGDPARIELLRSIKKLLDPSGIMNPGKVLI